MKSNQDTEPSPVQPKEEYIGNDVYIYGYDVLGNITSIKTATRSGTANETSHSTAQDYVTYDYSNSGELVEVVDYSDELVKKFTEFDYDTLGNITKKYIYTRSKVDKGEVYDIQDVTYNYGADPDSDEDGKSEAGWNRLLTSVTTINYVEGIAQEPVTENIDYDEIGNPISYLGAQLTWDGRQLTNYAQGDSVISYTYDSNGLRASKTVAKYSTFTLNGIQVPYIMEQTETKYYYVNGNLHYQHSVTTDTNDVQLSEDELYFFYDSNGYLTGVKYNGTNYYAATNRRGDVVAIYNKDLVLLAKYEYDAWGNVISIKDANDVEITSQNSIGVINPIRYRGYYYDAETKLYYLQSRYYNAEVGRFLNSDSISDSGAGVLGFNTFIYCANNPVNASDPSGHSIIGGIILGAAIGAVVNGAINLASQLKKNNGDWKAVNKKELGIATAIGAVSGALSGAFGFGVGELAKTAVTKTVATIIGEGLINTMVGNIQAMATGEERTLADNVTDFVQGSAISTFCTAIPVFNNNRIFNNATKSEKRSLLNNVFTNKQIRNGVTNTIEYGNYLLQGSEELTQCVGFAVTLFEEYTE